MIDSKDTQAMRDDIQSWTPEDLRVGLMLQYHRIGTLVDELAALKQQEPVCRVGSHWSSGAGFDVQDVVATPPYGTRLYLAPGAQPVPEITKESIRAGGGIVHADGNVFFTNLAQIKAMLEAAKEVTPVSEGQCKGML